MVMKAIRVRYDVNGPTGTKSHMDLKMDIHPLHVN